jgi:hypothetical protein
MSVKKANKSTEKKTVVVVNNNGNNEPVFWMKGDGSIRREHNIREEKRLIESGFSEQDIIRIARLNFSSKIANEYYEIALDLIKLESESESAMDYMKRKKAEKGE